MKTKRKMGMEIGKGKWIVESVKGEMKIGGNVK